MRRTAAALILVLPVAGILCPGALAGGPVISDEELNVTLALPDGFEPVPDFRSPPDVDIRYAYRRVDPDGGPTVHVFVERLGGVIGRERLDREQLRRQGAARVYVEEWKSFEVEVVVVREMQGDVAFVTRNVQVPIAPRAIQLKIVGPDSRDAEMADLTGVLLAGLDGPSNWLTAEQRAERFAEGTAKLALWIAAIGAGVYGCVAWRTSCFRRKAAAMGLPAERARQKIRPSWAWYLLPAYLGFAGMCVGSLIVTAALGDPPEVRSALCRALGLFLAAALAASGITGFLLWRRVINKRRMLAGPPAPPPLPPPT